MQQKIPGWAFQKRLDYSILYEGKMDPYPLLSSMFLVPMPDMSILLWRAFMFALQFYLHINPNGYLFYSHLHVRLPGLRKGKSFSQVHTAIRSAVEMWNTGSFLQWLSVLLYGLWNTVLLPFLQFFRALSWRFYPKTPTRTPIPAAGRSQDPSTLDQGFSSGSPSQSYDISGPYSRVF